MPPPLVSFSQQDFIDLVERLLPSDYWQPLISPGPGFEIYRAQAAIGARASLAIGNFQQAAFILSAPDGGLATAAVLFSRPTATAGAVTIKAGTVVQSTTYGRQFQLLFDVVFGAGDLSMPGTVQALFPGEQWNVKGPYQTAGGQKVPGEIVTVVNWILSPAYGDTTLTVAQTADASGGVSSVLNQQGADRGFTRRPGEVAAVFRQRIRTLPDTVSPSAIRNAIAFFSANYPGTTWDFIETWQPTYQEAFDCPSPNSTTPTYLASIPGTINTTLFVYDDPRPAYPPFRNRWLSEDDYRGAFIVTVPNLAAIRDLGMAYDDTAETPAALLTANGARAVNAYDVPQTNFASELQGAYDGMDYAKAAVYVGLFQSLESIKAGGVLVEIVLQGQ